jgi:two-component system, NtrC family, nitrogen regulation response regulator NtrX
MARILIVDDEDSIREVLHQLFEYEGHVVEEAASGMAAIRAVEANRPDLVFLDVKMQGMDGLDALERIRELSPATQVVMISGHGTIDTAVEATRRGAFDFLEKPLDTDRLLLTLRNVLEVRGLSESVARLRSEVEARHRIVGESSAIRELLERVERVAPTDARVLITGENGTGKELVARAIHRQSSRSEKPFVEVNCAAIPSELIESELFGHMKGSFTGAVQDRAGKFEQAHGGTLFLDEVGDMSTAAQSKVLRALEEGRVTRVGGHRTHEVDVRIVSATNKELDREIEEGRFREDLFYRLNVVPIHVPPLRERRADIPLLVEHFVALMSAADGLPPRPFHPDAVDRLTRLEWPGNVRELRNTVERLLILSRGEEVTAEDVARLASVGSRMGGTESSLLDVGTYQDFKEESERLFLSHHLQENDWNVSETARSLDMPRSNLYKKIERYGLKREE